jgi:hypothetical protein
MTRARDTACSSTGEFGFSYSIFTLLTFVYRHNDNDKSMTMTTMTEGLKHVLVSGCVLFFPYFTNVYWQYSPSLPPCQHATDKSQMRLIFTLPDYLRGHDLPPSRYHACISHQSLGQAFIWRGGPAQKLWRSVKLLYSIDTFLCTSFTSSKT